MIRYGTESCAAHDTSLQPYCADAAGRPLADAPSWCANRWCWVDQNNCNQPTDQTTYFPGVELSYSYEACGDANTFLGSLSDDSAAGNRGYLIASFTEERLALGGDRVTPWASTHRSIAASGRLLRSKGWPSGFRFRMNRTDTGEPGWEIYTSIYNGAHNLGWLIVTGQEIDCQNGLIWNSRDGRCESCPAGRVAVNDYECIACHTDQGEVVSDDKTSCVCQPGTYDSSRPLLSSAGSTPDQAWEDVIDPFNIFCWNSNKDFTKEGKLTFNAVHRGYPSEGRLAEQAGIIQHPDPGQGAASPNQPSAYDLKTAGGRRCVACPSCVTCPTREDGWPEAPIQVAEGWALLDSETAVQDGVMHETHGDNDLDLFKCELDACLAVELNATANQTFCKDSLRDGPLCSLCEGSYVKTQDSCKECDNWGIGEALALPMCLIIVRSWRWLSRGTQECLALNLKTAERSWPRIRQSLNILIANWQITSSIIKNTNITWPDAVITFFTTVGAWVDLDILSVPGIACLTSHSFYVRWLVKMCLMPVIGVLILAWYTYCRNMATKKSKKDGAGEARKVRERQGKMNHHEGSLAEVEKSLDSLSRKLKASVKISVLRNRCSSIYFMIVYLLYPGTAAAAFQMLHCRRLEGGYSPAKQASSQIWLLEADLDSACINFGDVDSTYRVFFWLGLLAICIYPIGVPMYLLYALRDNRETIQKNPDYISIGGLKPMFIFYKPDCYLWEVYFMLQKVVLIGVMGTVAQTFGAGPLTDAINILFTVFMIVVLVRVQPSKTWEYNVANAFSQSVLLLMYMAAQYTKSVEELTDDEYRKQKQHELTIFLGCIQLLFIVPLIYVSTIKLREYWKVQKIELKTENRIKADADRIMADEGDLELDDHKAKAVAVAKKQHELNEASLQLRRDFLLSMDSIAKELKLSESDLTELAGLVKFHPVGPKETIAAPNLGRVEKRAVGGGAVFGIIDGAVEVFEDAPKLGKKATRTLQADPEHQSIIGEREVIVDMAHPVWVRSSKPTQLLRLSHESLMTVINKPGRKMHDNLATRFASIRAATEEHVATQPLASESSGYANMDMNQAIVGWNEAKRELAELQSQLEKAERVLSARDHDATAGMRKAYNTFDKNGDRSLDMEEILAVMRTMGQDVTDHEKKLLQVVATSNGTPQLDFKEFRLLWGTDVQSAMPIKAWVGGIPNKIKAEDNRLATVAEQQTRVVKAFARIGHVNSVEVWEERSEEHSWARVTFKGVHGLALAVSVLGTDDEARIEGEPLKVDPWNAEKEVILAQRLNEELEDWAYGYTTIYVKGLDDDLAVLARRKQSPTKEVEKPVTVKHEFPDSTTENSTVSLEYEFTTVDCEFIPCRVITGTADDYASDGCGPMKGFDFKCDGRLGPGYYKHHHVHLLGSHALTNAPWVLTNTPVPTMFILRCQTTQSSSCKGEKPSKSQSTCGTSSLRSGSTSKARCANAKVTTGRS